MIVMCWLRLSEMVMEEVFELLRVDGVDVVILDVEGKFF